MLVVVLGLLCSILYRDRLPDLHWNEVIMGPPLASPPMVQPPASNEANSTNTNSTAPRRVFRWDPRPGAAQAPASTDFAPEAPPLIGVPDGVGGRNDKLGTFLPNPVAAPPPLTGPLVVQNHPNAPVSVGGDVQMAKVIRKVLPEYPALARQARISGVVHLVGIISKDGKIENLQLVSGPPLLAHAAIEAVRQWLYKPTLLDGMPVEVIAPIEVKFILGQ